MLALKLVIGAIVLIGIGYILRTPPKGFWRGTLAFMVMFALTAAVISTFAPRAGIVRDDDYGQIAANALNRINTDPTPYILFVGASYSRNALDDISLGKQLQRLGYQVQVINFSLEGSSLQERSLRLSQLLRAAPRPPQAVFFEISKRFDNNPVYGFEVAKFSNRVIGQYDLQGSKWAISGLIEQAPEMGIGKLLKNTVLLATHSLINLTNIGLFSSGSTLDDLDFIVAYDPQETPKTKVEDRRRNHGLLAPNTTTVMVAPKWATAFRQQQHQAMINAGVSHIGYYFPPVIDPAKRAYVTARCLEYENCIAPDDIELLAQLDADLWLDENHLLVGGARIYTNWLATQLDTRNALGPHNPKVKLAMELRR